MAEFAFYCNSFATASGDHEKEMIRRAGESGYQCGDGRCRRQSAWLGGIRISDTGAAAGG